MRTRTICLAIAEVSDKREFYNELREALDLSRRIANRAVTCCVEQDAELMTGGKLKKLYVYPMLKHDFSGISSAACSICRAVETKYKQERWYVQTGQKSVCHYRSFPWPLLHNSSTKLIHIEDDGECLTARLKLKQWWNVRFAGGARYRDQIKGIRLAMAEGKIGDSKIWIDRKHRAIVGLSVSLPKVESKAEEVMTVATCRDHFVTAAKARTRTPFVVTGDKLKAWEAERNRKFQRLRQDRKSGSTRRKVGKLIDKVSGKWKRRLDSFTHEAAAHVVSHAKRTKCGKIVYDATVKSFMKSFPWHDFKTKLAYKCEDAGIEFQDATQRVEKPDVDKPHVYFKYAVNSKRVKIGMTKVGAKRHKGGADVSEPMIILSIYPSPKTQLRKQEQRFQNMFNDFKVDDVPGQEWFEAEPVINYLREVDWLGNAGNLSEIAQYIPVAERTTETPTSRVSASGPETGCSQEADKRRRYPGSNPAAVEVGSSIDCD